MSVTFFQINAFALSGRLVDVCTLYQFHYGLKGQKRIAQGKANKVSRHPGCIVSITISALKGQKHFS